MTPRAGRPALRRLLAASVAAGLLSTATQTALLAELLVDAAGDEASLGSGLSVWLLGVAAGAFAARRLPAARALAAASAAFALLGLAAQGAVVSGRLLRLAWAPPAGELPGLGLALGLAASTLGPAGLLAGLLFTALATAVAAHVADGLAPSRVYALEAAGSAAGGLLVTALAASGVSPLHAALAAGVLGTASAAVALRGRAAAAAAAVLVVGAGAARALDDWSERRRFEGIAPGAPVLAVAWTSRQHLVLSGEGPYALYASGQLAASFPDPWTAEAQAHTLGLLSARPRRVLATSALATGALRFLLAHGVEELTLVDPDPRATAFVRRFLPAADDRALSDPRVRLVADDPRRFLAREGGAFDLVVLLSPDPVTLLSARLTTAEAFAAAARRLAGDGVLVARVRTAPLVLTAETRSLSGSVFGALASAFPVVRATPGPDTLLVAGSAGVATLDPAVLAERLRSRGIASRSFGAELLPLLFPPERVAATEEALGSAARSVPPSRDDRPASLLYALARRQEETRSGTGRLLAAAGRLPESALAAAALAPSLVALGVGRRRRRRDGVPAGAVHAVAAAGAAAMTASFLLLLSYQTRCGALLGHLGVLTAVFMLGLASGAGLAERRAAERGALPRRLLVFAGATGLLPLALPTLLALPVAPAASLALHAACLGLAGALAGAVVPAASHALASGRAPAASAAARLEAADHAGAALAALLSAAVLVPRLGLGAAAALAGGLLVLAAAATGRSPWGPRRRGRSRSRSEPS